MPILWRALDHRESPVEFLVADAADEEIGIAAVGQGASPSPVPIRASLAKAYDHDDRSVPGCPAAGASLSADKQVLFGHGQTAFRACQPVCDQAGTNVQRAACAGTREDFQRCMEGSIFGCFVQRIAR